MLVEGDSVLGCARFTKLEACFRGCIWRQTRYHYHLAESFKSGGRQKQPSLRQLFRGPSRSRWPQFHAGVMARDWPLADSVSG